MFTGLVEETGKVRSVGRNTGSLRLEIECVSILDDLSLGDSVSIEGACQTVVSLVKGGFTVDTLAETLKKTTLGSLGPGSRVNLERAVRPSDRLGGHLVQGHVDGTGTIESFRRTGENVYLTVKLPESLLRYCISQGSVAISGVSLTIAELTPTGIVINIIPETWKRTSLEVRTRGDAVNIEVDMIAKYIERLFPGCSAGRLTADNLIQWGYGGKK